MKFVKFGSITLPTQDERTSHPIQGRSQLLDLPGGAYDQHGQKFEPRANTMTREFVIVPTDDESIDTQLRALVKEAGKGRLPLVAEDRDGNTFITYAKLEEVSPLGREPGTLGHQRVQMTWNRIWPYWIDGRDAPQHMDTGIVMDDGWTISGHYEEQSVTGTLHSKTVTNDGGFQVSEGYIIFKVVSGTITKPYLLNAANGLFIQFNQVLSAGDWLEIDFGKHTCILNGEEAYTDLDLAHKITWMQLELGDNDLEIGAQANTGTTTFYLVWSRIYL